MIVRELIKKLQKMPKEATIVVSGDDSLFFVASVVDPGYFHDSTFLYPEEWSSMEGNKPEDYNINAVRIG